MTPHRIYVAGGSSERLAVRGWIERLTATGLYEVTHDWTRDPGYDEPRSLERDQRAAELDIVQGVRAANLVWYLVPDNMSEGASFELGYAHGRRKRVLLSGRNVGRSVFHARFTKRFLGHCEAFEWLTDRVRHVKDYYLAGGVAA